MRGHTRINPTKRARDISDLSGIVPKKVLSAVQEASTRLSDIGVPHVVIGGIAVGMHGYPRNTKDVDFLVSDAAYRFHGPIVTMKEGIPIEVAGVAVDNLSISEDEDFLLSELREDYEIPIVSFPALVYLKLKAGRRRDLADLDVLIENNPRLLSRTRNYLKENAPHLVADFDEFLSE